MNISKIAVERPVTAIMMLLAIILVGVICFMGLSIDLMPEMELPVALMMISYPNASPEEVETMITAPIEQTLATLENLDQIQSISLSNMSLVMVQFAMKTDMDFATLDMREKISMVEMMLPDESGSPMIMKMDMNAMPIMGVYVSGDMDLAALNTLAKDEIGPAMERVAGVASVSIAGGVEEEIAVVFQQEHLAGYGLSLATIAQMLSADNINLPSGDILSGDTEIIVRTLGKFTSVDDIATYPLTLPTREVIQIKDIASVELQYAEQESISRIDGQQAVSINITKQSVANTADVSEDVLKVVDELKEKFPQLSFAIGYDQADFINAAVGSVSESAVSGAILAIIAVFLFLKSFSSTLVIAISIPTSLLSTFILMNVTGMTLNMFTLCALTLAVGMLVDNSVVVLENIYRVNQLQSEDNPQKAAINGSKEVFLAVIASTLTSVVVYLPIALSSGMASMILADFCWTIIIALLASLLVALTVVPMLSSRLLHRQVQSDYIRFGSHRYRMRLIPQFIRFIEWLTRQYGTAITYSLKKRKLVVITCVIVFIASLAFISILGMELLPATDEGTFTVSVESPYGTSLAEQDQIARQVENYLLSIPELKHVTLSVGEGGSSLVGGSGSNTSSFSVSLIPSKERNRSTAQVARQAEMDLPQIPGAKIAVEVSSTTAMMLGGADISLMLQGRELNIINEIVADISEQLLLIDGIKSVENSMEEGNPELRVTLNRNIAAYYGITAYQLSNALSTALSGSTATKITLDGVEINVNLSLNESYRHTLDNMKQIPITTPAGLSVPVGQVAEFSYGNSPTQIARINQLRTVVLDLYIEGRDLGSVNTEAMAFINNYPLPDGYSFDTGGQQEEMLNTFGDLIIALVAAVALVFIVLASQFESLRLAFIVMLSVPFAFSGSFLALFIANMRLSITAMTGLIMLVGIVVNNAILLIEFINQNKDTMERDQAVIEAGMTRMRPILITTITTVVGMIPLSLSSGNGGEMLAPIGVSVMGGLIGSTLVTLFLIPVFYTYMDDKRQQREVKKAARHARLTALEEKWELMDNKRRGIYE